MELSLEDIVRIRGNLQKLKDSGLDFSEAQKYLQVRENLTLDDYIQESNFHKWYSTQAQNLNLDPNPDDPKHHYDYRAAFQSGATPDETGHFPSQFKADDHPKRFVDGVDTKTGKAQFNIPPLKKAFDYGIGLGKNPLTKDLLTSPEKLPQRGLAFGKGVGAGFPQFAKGTVQGIGEVYGQSATAFEAVQSNVRIPNSLRAYLRGETVEQQEAYYNRVSESLKEGTSAKRAEVMYESINADIDKFTKAAGLELTDKQKKDNVSTALYELGTGGASAALSIAGTMAGVGSVVIPMYGLHKYGELIKDARKHGETGLGANVLAGAGAVAEMGLEMWGVNNILGVKGKYLQRLVRRFLIEGGEEFTQELSSNIIKKIGWNGINNIMENTFKSFLIGGFWGGMAHTAIAPIEYHSIKKEIQAGNPEITEEQANKATTEILEKGKEFVETEMAKELKIQKTTKETIETETKKTMGLTEEKSYTEEVLGEAQAEPIIIDDVSEQRKTVEQEEFERSEDIYLEPDFPITNKLKFGEAFSMLLDSKTPDSRIRAIAKQMVNKVGVRMTAHNINGQIINKIQELSKGDLRVQEQLVLRSQHVRDVMDEVFKKSETKGKLNQEALRVLAKDFKGIDKDAEPGWFAKTVAVPDNMFRKLGMSNTYRYGRDAQKTHTMYMEAVRARVLDLKDPWLTELKLKGLKESDRTKVLYRVADGTATRQEIESLTEVETKLMELFRKDMDTLADLDGLAVDERITNYIVHEVQRTIEQGLPIFDAVKQNLDRNVKDVRNPSLLQREGINYTLKEDFWSAWELRHKLSSRKINFEPVAGLIEIASSKLKPESARYVANWFRVNLLKQADVWDIAAQATIKKAVEMLRRFDAIDKTLDKLNVKPGTEARAGMSTARGLTLLGTMAYNFGLSVRNLFQTALHFTFVPVRTMVEAAGMLMSSNEDTRTMAWGIVNLSKTLRGRYPVASASDLGWIKGLLSRGLYTYKAADRWNVSEAFMGSVLDKAHDIAKEMKVPVETVLRDILENPAKYEELLELSDDEATASQVGYSSPELPPILWSQTGKTVFQFSSWSLSYVGRFMVENYNRLITGKTSSGIKLSTRQRIRVMEGLFIQAVIGHYLKKWGWTAFRTFGLNPVLEFSKSVIASLVTGLWGMMDGLGGMLLATNPKERKRAYGQLKKNSNQAMFAGKAMSPGSGMGSKLLDALKKPSLYNIARLVLPLKKKPKKKKNKGLNEW